MNKNNDASCFVKFHITCYDEPEICHIHRAARSLALKVGKEPQQATLDYTCTQEAKFWDVTTCPPPPNCLGNFKY
jgi:hypothetical protein